MGKLKRRAAEPYEKKPAELSAPQKMALWACWGLVRRARADDPGEVVLKLDQIKKRFKDQFDWDLPDSEVGALVGRDILSRGPGFDGSAFRVANQSKAELVYHEVDATLW